MTMPPRRRPMCSGSASLDAALLGAEGFGSRPITQLDQPARPQAYLDTLRWSAVTSTQTDLFQSPFRAGISLKAHQLEPLRRALLLPRANLLVADDVGLGKTIEAGLVLSELLLRQRVRRAVVACPPSVVLQWEDELYARFGLFFRVIDRGRVTPLAAAASPVQPCALRTAE